MPTCGNCQQEVDFYEHGGLFYCNECDTQSQVMRVIEKDDDFITLDFARSYSTIKKRKAREIDEDDDNEQERSWWSCELYQAILKAQVKALVAMGFPAKLDEIVMQKWFHYLSKSRLAFCKAGGAAKHQLDESDDEKGKEEDVQDKLSPSVPPTKTKGSKIRRRVHSKDNWLNCNEKGDVVHNRSCKSNRIRLYVWDSVCFMYMGLQVLEEPVLLSDMLRWVRQGHLPLRSTTDILPEHISKNMSVADINRFCNPLMCMPDVNYVFGLFRQLSGKLDITPRPMSQRDMSLTIARMIHTLNLPGELCSYAHHLHLEVQPSLDKSLAKLKPIVPECFAVAYIIVALKLLFTLNDRTEHTFSSQTRRLQSLFPEEVCLFNWDTWVEAQKLRVQQNLSHERSVQNSSDLKNVLNVNGFVQYFNNYYRVEPVHKHLHISRHSQHGCQERLKEYQRPFRALHKESSSTRGPRPSSFAMARTLSQPDSDEFRYHGNPSLENSDDLRRPSTGFGWLPRDYLLNEDFSKHTLKHLTNLQELCEQYVVPPKSVEKVLDSAVEKACQFGSNGVDETGSEVKGSRRNESRYSKKKSSVSESPTGLLSRSGKRKDVRKKKRSHKKHKKSEKIGLSDDELPVSSEDPTDEDVNETSGERLRGIRLDNPLIPYVTYPTISKLELFSDTNIQYQMDSFHTSMVWLLDRCSKMAEMKKTQYISFCVHNVEKVLLKE